MDIKFGINGMLFNLCVFNETRHIEPLLLLLKMGFDKRVIKSTGSLL